MRRAQRRARVLPDGRWISPPPTGLAAAAVGAFALAARLWPVVHGGGLSGLLGYDDGVYYSSADALLLGQVPYRDFLFLHPPGILVLLSPFTSLGWLTSDPTGFAAARLATIALGSVNAVLVTVNLRRFGLAAAVISGGSYAAWSRAVSAETTISLEPVVNCCVLVALLLLGRAGRQGPTVRAQWLAGVCLGVAVTVKIWGVVPLVVVLVWQYLTAGVRPALCLVAGAGTAIVAICLPFFALGPESMFRMVVTDQLGRPTYRGTTLDRLESATGAELIRISPGPWPTVVALVLVACVMWAAATAWRRPDARLYVALLAATTGALLLSPSYYDHYGAFVAPGAALTTGVAGGVLSAYLLERGRFATVGAVGAAAMVVTSLIVGIALQATGTRFPADRLRPVVAGKRCVMADSPAALIELDVLSATLTNGCDMLIDVTGLTLDLNGPRRPDGSEVPRRNNPLWQRALLEHLTSGDATVLVRVHEHELAPTTRRALHGLPTLAQIGPFRILGRRGEPQNR